MSREDAVRLLGAIMERAEFRRDLDRLDDEYTDKFDNLKKKIRDADIAVRDLTDSLVAEHLQQLDEARERAGK